jgi:hypothetical protein
VRGAEAGGGRMEACREKGGEKWAAARFLRQGERSQRVGRAGCRFWGEGRERDGGAEWVVWRESGEGEELTV